MQVVFFIFIFNYLIFVRVSRSYTLLCISRSFPFPGKVEGEEEWGLWVVGWVKGRICAGVMHLESGGAYQSNSKHGISKTGGPIDP